MLNQLKSILADSKLHKDSNGLKGKTANNAIPPKNFELIETNGILIGNMK